MQFSTIKIIVTSILFFAGVLFTTCKKYPEGGYHFNAYKKLDGRWKLTLYQADNIDSTNLTVGANTIPNYYDGFAEFAVMGKGKRVQINVHNHYRNYSVSLYTKSREYIGLKGYSNLDSSGCSVFDSQICQRDIFNPTNSKLFTWKIEKFTKNELILLSTTGNYKIILVK